MPEFEVVVTMQVHSGFSAVSTSDVFLCHVVRLPFAPYVGLKLSDGDWDATLAEVVWDAREGLFKAYTESDKELYSAGLAHYRGEQVEHRPIDTIVAEWEEAGWSRRG